VEKKLASSLLLRSCDLASILQESKKAARFDLLQALLSRYNLVFQPSNPIRSVALSCTKREGM